MEKKYQIFISSTYTDLIEAREKVRDAILTMMHFPIGMEMFSAADEEQWEIIKETIDSSDYYVLIVGHRYGTVIEAGNDAGISYTEKEFRYAREKKIPILAFLLRDEAPVKKTDVESDSQKIEKLVAFKNEVKNDRIVEWWETPDELAQKVTAALHKQMNRKKRPGWVRSDSFSIEESHAEILKLNQLVRELQAENAELKSKMVERIPKLVAEFALDDTLNTNKQDDSEEDESIENECRSHSDLALSVSEHGMKIVLRSIDVEHYRNQYEPLDRSWVPTYLNDDIPDEELQQYNLSLPSPDKIDEYIENLGVYQRIRIGGVAFKLEIANNGTAKATDIRVFIHFPKEFLLFKISDIESMKEPEAPALPDNPIEKAEKARMRRIFPGLMSAMDYSERFDQYNTSASINALSRFRLASQTIDSSLNIEDYSLEAEIEQIPHRDSCMFDGIYIVPTQKGKFKVKVSIMCSEYLEPVENYIDIEVV